MEDSVDFLSLFDVSLETANKFYSWGWKASLFGAIMTLIGVSLLMWGTRIRDRDFELQVVSLNKEAANANERTAILEKSNIKLQTALERERSARLKIEAQLSPRKLNQEQIRILLDKLKQFAGQKFEIIEYGLSKEATNFCKEIGSTLSEAGWSGSSRWVKSGVEAESGVLVFISKNQPNIPAGRALADTLNTIGINTRYLWDDGFIPKPLEKGMIGLFVGPK